MPLQHHVAEALVSVLESPDSLLNPSSIHYHGRKTRCLLSESRENIARSLLPKTDPDQIIFTSSGTEANQTAIYSVLANSTNKGETPHWILSSIEHASVIEMVEVWKRHGGEISLLPVNGDGIVEIDKISELWRKNTKLLSLLWVNNETGVIQPVIDVQNKVKERGGLLHVDAAQAWGKLLLVDDELRPDYFCVSGHKIGAPAGCGLIYKRTQSNQKSIPFHSLIQGKQEKGRRGGTENVLGIYAMSIAAKCLQNGSAIQNWVHQVEPLRNKLEDAICQSVPGAQINGRASLRIANTSSISFQGIASESLVMALDLEGYSVSAGAACSSGVLDPSHVLLAMGRSREEALSSIRISLSEETKWEVLEDFVQTLEKVVKRMRHAK